MTRRVNLRCVGSKRVIRRRGWASLNFPMSGHFEEHDHFGFEAASWYWHFVDVVWVMLFLFVYIL